MITADNIVATAKGRLQLFDDSFFDALLLDDMFMEFKQFKNAETWILTDACLKVCGNIVDLPCKKADVERIRFYRPDSDQQVFLALTDPQKTQEFDMGGKYNYYFNGDKVIISSDNYDGYDVRLLYWTFIYDPATGERWLPDEYRDAAASFLCWRYYLYNPSPMNASLAKAHREEYINRKNQLKGEANRTNTPQLFEVAQIRNAISRYGYNLRFGW